MKTNTAGTGGFEVRLLHFDHHTQRWIAECQVGELIVNLCSRAGMKTWVVEDFIDAKVPYELSRILGQMTLDALADYQARDDYYTATGEMASGTH